MTNEECRRLIAAQGFFGRISCHYPEEEARYAIRRMLQNKSIIMSEDPVAGDAVFARLIDLDPEFVPTCLAGDR